MIGKLNFACRAVGPGRAFCRRLVDTTRGAKQPDDRKHITAAMREDLQPWSHFLDNYNGVSITLDEQQLDSALLHWYTDSASSVWFGTFF